MARLGRFVLPGIAHHVIQRGNSRQQMFFFDEYCGYYGDICNNPQTILALLHESYCNCHRNSGCESNTAADSERMHVWQAVDRSSLGAAAL